MTRAVQAMTGRIPQAATFAPMVEPILRAMASQLAWRDEKGKDHGGSTYDYHLPGTKTVLKLRLILDDMVDPPESGQFRSDGKKGQILIRVRKTPPTNVPEVLYHESMHMMAWIITSHGGAAAAKSEGVERRAVQGLDMSRFARQIASIRRRLGDLAASVDKQRKAGDQIKPEALDRVATWLLNEVQVRAETAVFQQTIAIESQRGRAQRSTSRRRRTGRSTGPWSTSTCSSSARRSSPATGPA